MVTEFCPATASKPNPFNILIFCQKINSCTRVSRMIKVLWIYHNKILGHGKLRHSRPVKTKSGNFVLGIEGNFEIQPGRSKAKVEIFIAD